MKEMIIQVQGMDIEFIPSNCKRKHEFKEMTYKRQRLQNKDETTPIFDIQKWHDRNHLSIRDLKSNYGNSILVIKKAKQIESILYSTSGCLLDYIDRNDLENRICKILTQFF